jgi:hypothetical protein
VTEYKIQPSTRRCIATGRELKPGDRCFSVLREEGGRFVRCDYSPEAWQGPPAHVFSFWAGRVPAEEGRKRPPIDDEMLLDCLQRLEGQDEPGRVQFRYVLALLLMRRKRLRFDEAFHEGGQEVLCLRCSRTGARCRVVNPALTDEELLTVQDDVFHALGWE